MIIHQVKVYKAYLEYKKCEQVLTIVVLVKMCVFQMPFKLKHLPISNENRVRLID
jgi:hypothetical protein